MQMSAPEELESQEVPAQVCASPFLAPFGS